MFAGCRQSTETGHTTAVAFLVVAFIFSPVILVVSRPLGYTSVLLASACSVLCLALAWFHWKKFSQLSMPSIAMHSFPGMTHGSVPAHARHSSKNMVFSGQ
jgi:hypothetical protein